MLEMRSWIPNYPWVTIWDIGMAYFGNFGKKSKKKVAATFWGVVKKIPTCSQARDMLLNWWIGFKFGWDTDRALWIWRRVGIWVCRKFRISNDIRISRRIRNISVCSRIWIRKWVEFWMNRWIFHSNHTTYLLLVKLSYSTVNRISWDCMVW